MKKLFISIAVLAMALTACTKSEEKYIDDTAFTAYNSADSAIDDIAAGCKENDKEAVKEAIKDLYEATKDETSEISNWKLNDEQEKRLEAATKDCGCYMEAAIAVYAEITAEEQK